MSSERHNPASTPCLCNALRQATRAVSRLYDEELRGVGLRTAQWGRSFPTGSPDRAPVPAAGTGPDAALEGVNDA